MKKRTLWSYTAGEKPNKVRVFERRPGGTLYVRVWDATLRGGQGDWVKRSLRHRDREAAKAHALQQAGKLKAGDQQLRHGKITLAQVLALYLRHRTPRKKASSSRKEDERRAELWGRVLGGDIDPHCVRLADWERFIDLRSSGAIDSFGRIRAEHDRRPVGRRAVEADCKWLRWVFSWATRWRTATGRFLMIESPVHSVDFEAPKEKNPRRPVVSQKRFEAVRMVSDQVAMRRGPGRRRVEARSYLSELLDLAQATGRRITPICQLRYRDLRLERTESDPFGAIVWPAETDKEGREWATPMNPLGRRAVDRVMTDRPGVGEGFLFPRPTDATRPISRHTASRWLRQAEELAGVAKQDGSLWHAYRRGWATARKHMPPQDVAKAGGWKTVSVVQDIYTQADRETTLAVILHGAEVREVG